MRTAVPLVWMLFNAPLSSSMPIIFLNHGFTHVVSLAMTTPYCVFPCASDGAAALSFFLSSLLENTNSHLVPWHTKYALSPVSASTAFRKQNSLWMYLTSALMGAARVCVRGHLTMQSGWIFLPLRSIVQTLLQYMNREGSDTGSMSPRPTSRLLPSVVRTIALVPASSRTIMAREFWRPSMRTSCSTVNSPTESCGSAFCAVRRRWSTRTLNSPEMAVDSTRARALMPHPWLPSSITLIT
mmetsp:Transcript_96765/g.269038  ORF Transcript_96765/g.269038 Transcript_96765/m.269038 type:complete len:241 (+) Transcript_96765:158-880(+)